LNVSSVKYYLYKTGVLDTIKFFVAKCDTMFILCSNNLFHSCDCYGKTARIRQFD